MDALLETFNALTNNSVSSALGEYYLKRAVELIKNYTNRNTKTVTTDLATYVIDLALHLNQQSSRNGLKSQKYSGVEEVYDTATEIPSYILKGLGAWRYFKKEEEVE